VKLKASIRLIHLPRRISFVDKIFAFLTIYLLMINLRRSKIADTEVTNDRMISE